MKKVLIVDDDKQNRFLLRLILEKEGFLVKEAQTGKECIDIMKEDVFDLVLLDVMMPDINGFDVYKEIKGKTPVIFLTALGERDIKERDIEYILKPIDIQIFVKKVKEKVK